MPTPDPDQRARAEIEQRLSDRQWRLRHLYWIRDKAGKEVRFQPNPVQQSLDDGLHTRNIVLKSRQHGVTTYACIRALDIALFRANSACGVVAHTKEDATKFFRDKILFAYDHLPDWLRAEIRITRRDMTGSLELSNGSRIDVSVSHRGGTLQFLHISEYGPMCGIFPQRAEEVKTGALNTLSPDAIAIIESTSYGAFGDFYDKCKQATATAERVQSGTAKLSALDYKLHFFPWWLDPANTIDPDGVGITKEDEAYFTRVEVVIGRDLTPGQRAWYVKKRAEQNEDMLREHPSTPDEAFQAAVEGAIFFKEMQAVRAEGRLRMIPHTKTYPVNTFWDLGHSDTTSIIFHQHVAMQNRFLLSYEKAGEYLDHFVAYLQRMSTERGYVYGTHYLPHDAEAERLQANGGMGKSILTQLRALMPGAKFVVVPKIDRKWNAISQARAAFPSCWFDPDDCDDLIAALDAYRWQYNARSEVFTDEPLHNQYSNYADAFQQFGQGYAEPRGGTTSPTSSRRRRDRADSHMTA